QSGLKLRPEIFDIRRGDHAFPLILLFERGGELTNSGDDVGARRQCETGDVGVTLLRRGTELTHRTKDDYPLPSATSSVEELDRGARRSGVRVVRIVDQGHVAHLLPGRAHLWLGHSGDSFGRISVADPAFTGDGERQHRVAQVVQPPHRWPNLDSADLD